MRLLIPVFSPTTGTWGGLTRDIAIAAGARAAGHAVAFCASGYLETVLRERGYTVFAMPPPTVLGLPPALSQIIERRSQRASLPVKPGRDFGSIWLVLLVMGLGRAGYLRRLVREQHNAARAFGADRLFTDLDPGAALLSAVTGLPLTLTYQAVEAQGRGTLPWRLMGQALNAVLADYNVSPRPPDELYFGEQVLKLVPSIPELDGTDPARPDVRYVGRLLAPIHADAADGFPLDPGRRYVFVYVGTGSLSLDRLEAVLPRLFPADGERVCLVGAQSVAAPYRLGSVEFHPYVPAEKVLPLCDWTICHGGQNTIMQSLVHGVPLLVFPGPIFERRENARRVQAAGAGLMGEVDNFTTEWLEAAFAQQNALAEQAAVLGERICSYGGAAAAVAAIEAHAGTQHAGAARRSDTR